MHRACERLVQVQATGAARLEQLAVPRRTLWERCSAERAEREAAQLRDCTFKPSMRGKPPAGAQTSCKWMPVLGFLSLVASLAFWSLVTRVELAYAKQGSIGCIAFSKSRADGSCRPLVILLNVVWHHQILRL